LSSSAGGKSTRELVDGLAVKNPNDYALQVGLQRLKKWGSGQWQVYYGISRKVLRLWPSILKKFAGYLSYMLKRSDNVYAGAIGKDFGNSYYGLVVIKVGWSGD